MDYLALFPKNAVGVSEGEWLEEEEEERVEDRIKEKRGKLLLQLEASTKTQGAIYKVMKNTTMTMRKNGLRSLATGQKAPQSNLDLALCNHSTTSQNNRIRIIQNTEIKTSIKDKPPNRAPRSQV